MNDSSGFVSDDVLSWTSTVLVFRLEAMFELLSTRSPILMVRSTCRRLFASLPAAGTLMRLSFAGLGARSEFVRGSCWRGPGPSCSTRAGGSAALCRNFGQEPV